MTLNEQFAGLGVDLDVSLHLRLFGLALARILAICQPIPFLGGNMVPARIRFGIPFVLTIFLYPFVTATIDPAAVPPLGLFYGGFLLKEFFVGYCLGYLISLPFHGVTSAGSFMDTQRGTTFAQVINPSGGGQTSLLGQLMNLLFLVLFVTIGGIQIVIEALLQSYQTLPVLAAIPTLHPNSPVVELVIWHSGQVFEIAVQFAAPVVIAMFMTDATLGIVNRAAPNIQVFFLGMPLKALGGLVVFFIVMGFAYEYLIGLIVDLVLALRRFTIVLMAT
jgi:flagellar biosynthetic protein FliR